MDTGTGKVVIEVLDFLVTGKKHQAPGIVSDCPEILFKCRPSLSGYVKRNPDLLFVFHSVASHSVISGYCAGCIMMFASVQQQGQYLF
jgi:hypothetical protein